MYEIVIEFQNSIRSVVMINNNAKILREAYIDERNAGIPQAMGGFDMWLLRSGAEVHNGLVKYKWPD